MPAKPPMRPPVGRGLAPVRTWPATASPTFFPCRLRRHSSRGNKLGCRRPPLTLRSFRCSRPARRLSTAIEAALGGFGQPLRRYANGSDRHLHPRRERRLRRHDQDPHPQRQGHHQALRPEATRRPTIASPPMVSSARSRLEQDRSRDGRRVPLPSSSTTRPSRHRSTPPSSRATKASTSSSGRDEPVKGAPLNSGAPLFQHIA